MRTITSLYRYPVKGLSPEALDAIDLQAGSGFPRDRELALTNGLWSFDPADDTPRPKSDFLMLMRHEALAALRTAVSADGQCLEVRAPDGSRLDILLDQPEDLDRLGRFLAEWLKLPGPGLPRLVRSARRRFTDVAVVSPALMQAVSVINLASVRDLGQRMGCTLDPLRFRANVYYDGGEPWEELAWVGRDLALGALSVQGVLRTRRCAATNVDPSTGVRDLGIPQALMRHFRHGDLGLYVDIRSAGRLRVGDPLHIPV